MSSKRQVPYGKSVHGEAEIAAVVEVLRTSTQMGPKVRAFEAAVAEILGKHCGIMVNSGSSANLLAVETSGLQAGDEVITPALTFATTVAPLVQKGLTPCFVDVEPGMYTIDIDKIERMLSPRTRALMVPSLIGNLPDWDRLRELADRHDLLVIEDSCDTLGATLRGTPPGTRTDVSTTSFYGSHVINCAGNGGLLAVNSEELADRCRLLRSWGRSSSLFTDSESVDNRFQMKLDDIEYDAKFVFGHVGYNFEPSELGAAFGLVQVAKLSKNVEARIEHFKQHNEFFARHEEWFVLPRQLPEATTGWLAYPLTLRATAPFSRRALQTALENAGVQTRVIFTGNILRQPGFKSIPHRNDEAGYPVADQVTRGGMLIGCHHGLVSEDIEYMHEAFENFARRY